jgi:hypothetical protein
VKDKPGRAAGQGIGVYFLDAEIFSKSNRFEEKTNHHGASKQRFAAHKGKKEDNPRTVCPAHFKTGVL